MDKKAKEIILCSFIVSSVNVIITIVYQNIILSALLACGIFFCSFYLYFNFYLYEEVNNESSRYIETEVIPSYFSNKEEMEWVKNIIKTEIYLCNSRLVEELLCKEIFNYDDISNLYYSVEKENIEVNEDDFEFNDEDEDEEQEAHEIYEWWSISEYLADKLIKLEQPVMGNEYGYWWGRTCTGQAIELDGIIQKIYQQRNKIDGND